MNPLTPFSRPDLRAGYIRLFTLMCLGCIFALPAFTSPTLDSVPQKDVSGLAALNTSSTRYDTPPSYPGGEQAWMMHLTKNVRYPQHAYANKIAGRVVVRFTVNEKGRLSDVDAVIGPKELRREAIRVIKASGRWNPALLNGQPVPAQKEQAIAFVAPS